MSRQSLFLFTPIRMTKNKYIIGAVAGATSLAVAFPLLAQFASAADEGMTMNSRRADRPAPSQACVHALAEKDGAFLSGVDAMITAHKAAVLAHKDALTAAAAITDDAQRKTAVDLADQTFHDAMEAAHDAQGDHMAEMEALKTACGTSLGFGHGFGGPMMRGKGPMKGGGFHMNQDGHGRGPRTDANSEGQ